MGENADLKEGIIVEMDRKLAFFASIAGILLGIVGVVFLLQILKPKTSGISIETNIGAYVFIDGRQVGRTPYDGTIAPHTALVKLVPYDKNLVGYETKVNLVAGIKTIIRRNFAQTETDSSGRIISFEKNNTTSDATISVVTDPDNAAVTLDGNPRGFAPIKISKVSNGVHQLSFAYPGYAETAFSIKTVDGYNLTTIVKLANVPATLGTQTQADLAPEVEVLRLPSVGYLKAKETPSTSSGEVGQVSMGERYKWLNTSSDLSWYEIDLGGGKSGWISAQYATLSGTLK